MAKFAKNNEASDVCTSAGIYASHGIKYSRGVSYSNGINDGDSVFWCGGVSHSWGVASSGGVNYSNGVNGSVGVCDSDAVDDCNGVANSMYCKNCEGISRCILCYGLEGAKLMLFNKPVTAARYWEVAKKIDAIANGWCPNFTNAEELRAKSDGQKWEATPADRITGRSVAEAYADMPAELEAYIKSLPEFDAEIYKAITKEDGKTMIKFYEDNAGGVAAVVFDDNGHVANVVCGCEQWADTPDAVISAAQEGLPYCPDYDADAFDGMPVDCLAAELDARSELIAVITPESVELYADDMGMAGRRLFGVEY